MRRIRNRRPNVFPHQLGKSARRVFQKSLPKKLLQGQNEYPKPTPYLQGKTPSPFLVHCRTAAFPILWQRCKAKILYKKSAETNEKTEHLPRPYINKLHSRLNKTNRGGPSTYKHWFFAPCASERLQPILKHRGSSSLFHRFIFLCFCLPRETVSRKNFF